jgi:oxygen-independent coproporphyrinogen III oxidase
LKKGLYVHIPFCLRKCHYCNYVITLQRSDEVRQKFFEALRREIEHTHDRYGALQFDTLYLGGGTPSALRDSEMQYLFRLLKRYFSIRSDCEITCEVNPGDVDPEKLKAYKAMGINRISLGVQSFNDSLLRDMGRIHDAQMIHETFKNLRKLGFENISADLIIRLPHQTVKDVEEAVRLAVEEGAKQIVVYDLNVHGPTVFGQRQKQGKLHLPDEGIHEAQFGAVEKILLKEGFGQYEISSFAKPGFESQHNLIYWKNQEYLGLGPGAFSFMNGKRYQIARDFSEYIEKSLSANWLPYEEEILTEKKMEMENLLTGLRLKEGFSFKQLKHLRDHVKKESEPLLATGLLKRDGSRILLTRKGKFLAESVFTQLSI